jgi:hypothetical protein
VLIENFLKEDKEDENEVDLEDLTECSEKVIQLLGFVTKVRFRLRS